MSETYNLVLCHVPGMQCISDFMVVRNMMVGRAPDIQVHIASAAGIIPAEFWKTTGKRPSLIFSPSRHFQIDASARGARLISARVNKLEELRLLAGTGAPVPETRVITPDLELDEAEWGPYTVVKPIRGKQGQGVRLMRTRDVRWTDTSALPNTDPRYGIELLAQRYVDTGPLLTCYRVLMVLGRPIYSVTSTAMEPRPPVEEIGEHALDAVVAANGVPRKVALSNDPEVISLARSIHAKASHLPVMGIDIIRDHRTGKLFALEYNSGGAVWHLSSGYGLKQQHVHGIDYYRQFNALETLTDALIEATRNRAQ